MRTAPSSNFSDTSSVKSLCLIVGIASLAGFALDLLSLGFPLNLLDPQWRLSFLQQTGDRGIILLIGAALTLYGFLHNRRLARQIAFACIMVGIAFHLSIILIIQDSITLRNQAIQNIGNQMAQVQARAQQVQQSSELPSNITPEKIEQVYQKIASQAESTKQNTEVNITRSAIRSCGNFLIIGLGLAGIGRFGIHKRA